MIRPSRSLVAGLSLSAAALVGIAQYEDYRGEAYVPVKGDVPTIGFGTTRNADGTPVKIGDRTTPVRALVALARDASAYEQALKACLTAPLHQHEFDAYVSLAYNVGAGAVCRSSIPRKLSEGKYEEACKTILDFNGMCLKRAPSGKCVVKKVLRGLDVRRKAEFKTCMGGE